MYKLKSVAIKQWWVLNWV